MADIVTLLWDEVGSRIRTEVGSYLFTEAGEVFNVLDFNNTAKECWCYHHDDGPKLFGKVEEDRKFFLKQVGSNLFGSNLFERLMFELQYSLQIDKFVNGAIVLCVMLGLNREWFRNVVHVGLVILSLMYDPVVAIGVYGYVVLTPDEDSHVA